jgi:hypothetical protein
MGLIMTLGKCRLNLLLFSSYDLILLRNSPEAPTTPSASNVMLPGSGVSVKVLIGPAVNPP